MNVQADRESDAVAAVAVSRLCYWLIRSNFDIWNSASRASLSKMKESISCSLGHDKGRSRNRVFVEFSPILIQDINRFKM